MRQTIYVMASLGMCGGVKVVLEHVHGLRKRGHDAQVWYIGARPSWWSKPLGDGATHQFPNTDVLGASLQHLRGVNVVATFWETAYWVSTTCDRETNRLMYFVQDIDGETYTEPGKQRQLGLGSYKLGLEHFCESKWVQKKLEAAFGVKAPNVGIAIDHDVYSPAGIDRDLSRVFVQHRPHSGPRDLKGWSTSMATLVRLANINPNASCVTFGAEGAPPTLPLSHIHVHKPSDAKLKELYSQAGVFLFTPRHEGFGLPALEAMACGTPVVSSYADGNEEFCIDGETCLMGRTPEQLAQGVNKLMSDATAWQEMSEAGLKVASTRRWELVFDRLEELYREVDA